MFSVPLNILHHSRNNGRGNELTSLLVTEVEAGDGLQDSLRCSPHRVLQSPLEDVRELQEEDGLPGSRQQEIIPERSGQPHLSPSGLAALWQVLVGDAKIVPDSGEQGFGPGNRKYYILTNNMLFPLPGEEVLVDQPTGEHPVGRHGVHGVLQLNLILVQENVADEAFS